MPQLGNGSTIFDFKETNERVMIQVLDLKFALDHVADYSNADLSKVASMGWSTGGIVALWLSQIDDRVDAVIGLDGSYMFKEAQAWVNTGITKKRLNFPILSFYRGHERQVGNVTHDFIKSLDWSDRYLIKVPNATHGEFCDDPNLMDQMNFEWTRKDFNTLEESLRIYYSVIKTTKLFIDSIMTSGFSSQKLHKEIEDDSKKRGLIYYNEL